MVIYIYWSLLDRFLLLLGRRSLPNNHSPIESVDLGVYSLEIMLFLGLRLLEITLIRDVSFWCATLTHLILPVFSN